MGNALLFVAVILSSLLGESTMNLATELLVKNALEQDRLGLGEAPSAPRRTDAADIVPESTGTAVVGAAKPPPAILAVLADAPGAALALPAQAVPAAVAPVLLARATQPDAVAPAAAAQPSATLLALARDTPTRRPDGSVFLPIGMQNMIGLRTGITRLERLSGAVQIPGRVVTSRDVGALVQSTQVGVLEASDGTVPRIGMRVANGQLLAYLRPVLDVVRTAELDARMAELEGLVEMGEQRIVRLREVMFIRYRQSKIEAVRAEITSYRRQLHIHRALLNDRVEIRARSAGVVSRVNFVVGQIVEAQTTLFEIVDPTRLWVEAAAFDPALADDIGAAQAITGDGRVLPLRFSGGGMTLQNQAVPLQFEVVGSVAGVQIGRPVTVVVQRRRAQMMGIRLPTEAIVRNATGETVVWQRLSAEAFISRPVQVVPLDGTSVMITSGLTENMRIVTAGSAMLAQVR